MILPPIGAIRGLEAKFMDSSGKFIEEKLPPTKPLTCFGLDSQAPSARVTTNK